MAVFWRGAQLERKGNVHLKYSQQETKSSFISEKNWNKQEHPNGQYEQFESGL
jgi:hypothetical protein